MKRIKTDNTFEEKGRADIPKRDLERDGYESEPMFEENRNWGVEIARWSRENEQKTRY